jgi:hypothetical protein
MHPNLYNAIMNAIGFNEEALMVALGYLVDNKAQGVNFVGLPEQHRRPSGSRPTLQRTTTNRVSCRLSGVEMHA